jgi:hypothetical protein
MELLITIFAVSASVLLSQIPFAGGPLVYVAPVSASIIFGLISTVFLVRLSRKASRFWWLLTGPVLALEGLVLLDGLRRLLYLLT